eukprot:6490431-Amphidinium_carterae.1
MAQATYFQVHCVGAAQQMHGSRVGRKRITLIEVYTRRCGHITCIWQTLRQHDCQSFTCAA